MKCPSKGTGLPFLLILVSSRLSTSCTCGEPRVKLAQSTEQCASLIDAMMAASLLDQYLENHSNPICIYF
jgi:hypothetical protein